MGLFKKYEFAIQTTSLVTLTALQLRCLAAHNSASFCAFTLPLSSAAGK